MNSLLLTICSGRLHGGKNLLLFYGEGRFMACRTSCLFRGALVWRGWMGNFFRLLFFDVSSLFFNTLFPDNFYRQNGRNPQFFLERQFLPFEKGLDLYFIAKCHFLSFRVEKRLKIPLPSSKKRIILIFLW